MGGPGPERCQVPLPKVGSRGGQSRVGKGGGAHAGGRKEGGSSGGTLPFPHRSSWTKRLAKSSLRPTGPTHGLPQVDAEAQSGDVACWESLCGSGAGWGWDLALGFSLPPPLHSWGRAGSRRVQNPGPILTKTKSGHSPPPGQSSEGGLHWTFWVS